MADARSLPGAVTGREGRRAPPGRTGVQDTVGRISKTPQDAVRALRDVGLGPEASAAMDKW